MVSEAPLIREAMTEFLRFVGEDILVGHNIQSFDMKFIYREVEELFQETVSNDFIDTLYMARKCLPEEAMTEFLRFVGEDILVGHNIQSFDMKFIYREVEELFQETVSNDFIDTLYMARKCLPELKHILVGHNIQSFDMKFIYREVEELFQETVSNDFIDTLYMARKCLPELKHHRLTDLAEHFGISSKGAHRALNDCVMNQKCFEAMLFQETVSNDFIDTLYMARKCLPELKHHRLTDLAEHFGISSKGAHRALNDCVMNQKCFEAMAKLQKKSVVFVCPKCGGEMIRRNGRYGEFWGCGNFPKCRYTQNI